MNINERNRIMVTMTAVFAVIGLVSFILTLSKDSNTTVALSTTLALVETPTTPASIPVSPTVPASTPKTTSSTSHTSLAASTSTAPKSSLPPAIAPTETSPLASSVASNTDSPTTSADSGKNPATVAPSPQILYQYIAISNDSPEGIASKCQPDASTAASVGLINKWPVNKTHVVKLGDVVLVPCQTMLLKPQGTTDTTTLTPSTS